MGKRRVAATLGEQLRRIYKEYVAAGGPLPFQMDALFSFAQQRNLWQPQPDNIRKQFGKQMSQALRDDIFTNDKGKTVRRIHAVLIRGHDADGNKVQFGLWDDIRTAPREHMEAAFQLRRGQIVGDCKQLKNDVDHFNDNRTDTKPIQLLLDFTDDATEADLSREYDPDPVD